MVTTSEDVRLLLETKKFDIIHVAMYVCPTTGDLIFSAVDPETKKNASPKRESMSAEMFGDLVRRCGARLVVLANNERLALVVKLLPITSVIFALEPVDPKMIAQWIKAFYMLLSTGLSPYDACKKAFALHQIPMRLYPQLGTGIASREHQMVGAVAAPA
ncbi:MAG TPA: hypothetical protein VKZ53_27185 [Candidatus Angelobacter sp.]|nr:hypothetical protein [Candidatus Angelobacter sp.]